MENYGCSIPFYQTPNISVINLCNDSKTRKEALDMFGKLYYSPPDGFGKKECLYPCTNLMIKMMNIKETKETISLATTLELHFNEFTQVITAHYTYTELELLAEFGGYVGLFLGYSVLNLTDVFYILIEYSRKALPK